MTSTWSSTWSSSLSHRHRHHITVTVACHRDTVIDTVIVIATSYTVTLAIKREHQNSPEIWPLISQKKKSISRLLNMHIMTDLIKKEKKGGVHDGIWLLIRKLIGASREDEEDRRWERDRWRVCVCVYVCLHVCLRACKRMCVCIEGKRVTAARATNTE